MKIIKSILISAIILSLSSCASDNVTDKNTIPTPAKTESITPEIEVPKENKEDINFSKSVSNIFLSFKNTNIEGTVSTPFSTPISVIVKDSDNKPVTDTSITISYPIGKEKNSMKYETAEVITNSDGIASFTPPVFDFCFKDQISAYPTPINKKDKNVKAAKTKEVKANFSVKSDFYKKGILLYIYEYDERDKPKNNFYPVLGEIRILGGKNVGNAPINDAKSINDSPSQILEKIKSFAYINADKYDYVIVGTVKFTTPTTKVDGGYSCSMISDMYAISMKTGEVLYKDIIEETGFGKNWGQDQTDCKNKIGKKIVNDLLYTLQ